MPDEVLDDALLLVSELVTNSTRNANTASGALIRVRGVLEDRTVRLQVLDRGRCGAVAMREPGTDRYGGFGLQLVASLARDWGVRRALGTEAWFELHTGWDKVAVRRAPEWLALTAASSGSSAATSTVQRVFELAGTNDLLPFTDC